MLAQLSKSRLIQVFVDEREWEQFIQAAPSHARSIAPLVKYVADAAWGNSSYLDLHGREMRNQPEMRVVESTMQHLGHTVAVGSVMTIMRQGANRSKASAIVAADKKKAKGKEPAADAAAAAEPDD